MQAGVSLYDPLPSSDLLVMRLTEMGVCAVALLAVLLIHYWSLRDLRGELYRLREVIGRLPVRAEPDPPKEQTRA